MMLPVRIQKVIHCMNVQGVNPFAVWAQTRSCLDNYADPFSITATLFDTEKVHPLDIHTMEDLLEAHREHQVLDLPPAKKNHDLQ